MIREIRGNLLKSEANIICHQTNCHGIMGAGVAKLIKKNILTVEQYNQYRKLCKTYGKDLLGQIQYLKTSGAEQYIANCFAQDGYSRDGIETDYVALKACLQKVHDEALRSRYMVSLLGYMGCGLAGGDWNVVYTDIILPIFLESSVTLTIVYQDVKELWNQFGDVPMDLKTESLELPWHGFQKGTFREDIWHWFERTFEISVTELMYGEPECANENHKGNSI